MICVRPCNTAVSQRCGNGALCATDPTLEMDFCMPGAGYPETVPLRPDTCTSPVSCAFGEACAFEIDAGGMCEPVCANDSECRPGTACWVGACQGICDVMSPGSCPRGYGCSRDGICRSESALAACPGADDCPIGTICTPGNDGRFFCDDRTGPPVFANCPPDQQFYGRTLRCYPRSELRPVR